MFWVMLPRWKFEQIEHGFLMFLKLVIEHLHSILSLI